MPDITREDRKLARRLKQLRADLGLLGEDVERLTGIGTATLSLIENAKQIPSVPQLRELGRAYGVSFEVGGSQKAPAPPVPSTSGAA